MLLNLGNNMKKLLQICNHKENDYFVSDALFVVGRLIQSDNSFNGGYVVFNSPIKHRNHYVDPIKFTTHYGVCYNRYLIICRKVCDKWMIAKNSAVSPIK
jgi:hypothetical protein